MSEEYFSMRVYIVGCITFCIMVCIQVQPAAAADFVVDTTSDTVDASAGDGSCADSGSDCSLRAAIQEANALAGADTITLPAGDYVLTLSGIGSGAGDLDITDSSRTTITGAGSGTTTIDASSLSSRDRVFEVNGTATIADVTITGGRVLDDLGGGVIVDGDAILDSVLVTNNTSELTESVSGGAGVDCYTGGNLTIIDSTVSGNGTSVSQTYYGGGIGILNCDVDIQRTTITENVASQGAGLYVQYSNSSYTFSLSDSTISTNAGSFGGGLYHFSENKSDEVVLSIDAVVFDSNTATSEGGAYHAYGSGNITNAIFIDNADGGDGGALHIRETAGIDMSIAHSTIIQNFADSDDNGGGLGGGIYLPTGDQRLTMNGSILAENYEGNPTNSSATWVAKDCDEESTQFTSLTYSVLGTATDCTPTTTSNVTEGSSSVYYTISLEDRGGDIQVVAPYIEGGQVDLVPEVNCVDAAGDPLTRDARGLTRPENGDCDIGAVEFDQTDPTVFIVAGTDTIECSVDTWEDAVQQHWIHLTAQ